jgi:opacity protein-like surface antigen
MGGIALDLTHHLKVDLGYRYSRLGGEFASRNAPARPPRAGAHEFRIGARYLLD